MYSETVTVELQFYAGVNILSMSIVTIVVIHSHFSHLSAGIMDQDPLGIAELLRGYGDRVRPYGYG